MISYTVLHIFCILCIFASSNSLQMHRKSRSIHNRYSNTFVNRYTHLGRIVSQCTHHNAAKLASSDQPLTITDSGSSNHAIPPLFSASCYRSPPPPRHVPIEQSRIHLVRTRYRMYRLSLCTRYRSDRDSYPRLTGRA